MIVLNECRIDPEGKCLIIDASVENLDYFKDIGIAHIIIDTQETFVDSGPSNKAIFHHTFDEEPYTVGTIEDCSPVKSGTSCKCDNIITSQKHKNKHVKLTIKEKELGVSLNDNIFFIYIISNGIPSSCTPCGMDKSYVMGIAVNLRPIYNMAMNYIKELDSNCTIPKGFIDMILRLKAFWLALKTGNYITAFKYWDKLFKNKVNVPMSKRCGCNGIT